MFKLGSNIRKKLITLAAITATLALTVPLDKVNAQEIASDGFGVSYQTHVENIGWQGQRQNGELSGTEGKGYRLESISIALESPVPGMKIKYKTHVQDYGWQNWSYNGQVNGTEGKGKRLEGIQIQLEGAPAGYHVEYNVHIQDIGWQGWVSDGQFAGTSGESKRLEAIKVRIIKPEPSGVVYKTHVENIGWQGQRQDGELSGTEGKGYRLEGISIGLVKPLPGMKIKYRTHVQDYGWQPWAYNGQISGTSGKSKRLEGIQIQLEGAPPGYYVEYRVHVQDIGWQGWVRDGQMAGTSGMGKRLEAIQIRTVFNGEEKYNKVLSYINENNISSKTNYAIYTSLKNKETYIFKGSNKNWTLIDAFPCDIGRSSTPTITGTFEISGRKLGFGDWKTYSVKYATRIYGGYYYHSILYNVSGTKIIDTTLDDGIGDAVSHGCVRLKPEIAKWIYDNIPDGTKVIIN